jgi:Acetyl-CoA carboxylase, BT domain
MVGKRWFIRKQFDRDGLMILLDGKRRSVYWTEKVGSTRLLTDSETRLIEQENDLTRCSF